jgi:uncharacterized membrane protein
MFCHRCGTQAGDAAFCASCGQPLTAAARGSAASLTWTAPQGVQAASGRWLGEAWNLVMADLGSYVVITLLFILLNGIPLIQGALIAGFHIYTIKKLTGQNPQIGDYFQGFNFFIPTLLATIVIGLFTFLGTLAFIIPGIVIAAMYKFTYLFIVDKRMDFWQAMQASHAVVKNDYLGFTLFLLLAFLVNVLGFFCLFVGLLVTIPMTFAAITIAYREIVGFEPQTASSL